MVYEERNFLEDIIIILMQDKMEGNICGRQRISSNASSLDESSRYERLAQDFKKKRILIRPAWKQGGIPSRENGRRKDYRFEIQEQPR